MNTKKLYVIFQIIGYGKSYDSIDNGEPLAVSRDIAKLVQYGIDDVKGKYNPDGIDIQYSHRGLGHGSNMEALYVDVVVHHNALWVENHKYKYNIKEIREVE